MISLIIILYALFPIHANSEFAKCESQVRMTVTATGYTDRDRGCHPSRKTRYPDGRHKPGVAVDRRVIPLGSHISIDGGRTWLLCDDIGGSKVKGRRIDIRMASRHEALQWGRRKIVILVRGR